MVKAAFNKKNTLFTRKQDLNLRMKPVKCYVWSKILCVPKIGHFIKSIDLKYLGSSEMCCWRRITTFSYLAHTEQHGTSNWSICKPICFRKILNN
jgi:hypothetical protein